MHIPCRHQELQHLFSKLHENVKLLPVDKTEYHLVPMTDLFGFKTGTGFAVGVHTFLMFSV